MNKNFQTSLHSFYFLRHGETDWNRDGILMGQADIPLNDTGRKQAHSITNIFDSIQYGDIFVSPLSRAYETSQIIARGNKRIHILHGLKERKFPSGMKHKDLHTIESDNLYGTFELWSDFSTRVTTTLDYVLAHNHHLPPVIISHGGVLIAICKSLNLSPIDIDNCKLLYFKQEKTGYWSIQQL